MRCDVPSGHAVLVFPTNSISMLEILVGFASVSVSKPRSMPGGASACIVRCLPVASPARRKTTDSARRMSSPFFCCCLDCGIGDEREVESKFGGSLVTSEPQIASEGARAWTPARPEMEHGSRSVKIKNLKRAFHEFIHGRSGGYSRAAGAHGRGFVAATFEAYVVDLKSKRQTGTVKFGCGLWHVREATKRIYFFW